MAVGILATGIVSPLRGQAVRELSPEQRAEIDAGHDVFMTWPASGSPWPRACVFRYVDATPAEATAVFMDYERHAAYIPDLKKARISRVIDPATVEVDYRLRVPIVADEDYTVRDHLSSVGDTSFTIEWTLVRATTTKATEGSVRFERYRLATSPRDGTLMAYCNLVTPGSRLAGLRFIKSRALSQVRATARAIGEEVTRQRASDRARLAAELRALRAALVAARASP
ncbi:MAG TPA: hypothetical protein VFN39_05790 [Gemmatimonadaceae bacterium]|nr:hypothetical protein [Gemmatimonadaceae bacterium]